MLDIDRELAARPPSAVGVVRTVVSRPPAPTKRQRAVAHLRIARCDHSIKQLFILPGVVIAVTITGQLLTSRLFERLALGLVAATCIASSNYVLNELLDAPYDRRHPTKKWRPAAAGLINPAAGYAQWLLLMLAGMALAATLSFQFVISTAALWAMGCIYNIAPIRTKEIAYLDVLTESINNPIRFCIGWYIVATVTLPPVSLLLFYWMLGAYFMALKRFSEYRQIGDHVVASMYRRSFRFYNERSLLNSASFYAAAAMLFFGAFVMRYRMELILSFPGIAWVMAVYFGLSFEPESAVQNPEKLYKERRLMIPLLACVLTLVYLSFVRLPWLATMFPKSTP